MKSASLSLAWWVSRFDGFRFEAGMSFWWRWWIARESWKKREKASCSDRGVVDEKSMGGESAYSVR